MGTISDGVAKLEAMRKANPDIKKTSDEFTVADEPCVFTMYQNAKTKEIIGTSQDNMAIFDEIGNELVMLKIMVIVMTRKLHLVNHLIQLVTELLKNSVANML